MADSMKKDLAVKNETVSQEISELFEVFRSLIRTKKFENNDLLVQEDALAVIDLAEACNMFLEDKETDPNHRAAGICYSNIGNI